MTQSRDGGGAATRQGGQEFPSGQREAWVHSPPSLGRASPGHTWISDFWPPEWKRVTFCCSEPPSLWSFALAAPRTLPPSLPSWTTVPCPPTVLQPREAQEEGGMHFSFGHVRGMWVVDSNVLRNSRCFSKCRNHPPFPSHG